jgi:predicted Rossmann-fold nucleotide-binding protein
MAIKNVCVFCGARDGNVPSFRVLATALGVELARRGMGLVYGGAAQGRSPTPCSPAAATCAA